MHIYIDLEKIVNGKPFERKCPLCGRPLKKIGEPNVLKCENCPVTVMDIVDYTGNDNVFVKVNGVWIEFEM